ncbi:MAG: selenium cofactor biosynthesis protein YqeC [Gammaproteobacteria bacterium]
MHVESTKHRVRTGSASKLIAALGIDKGIVSFVGAGGKKSAMMRIAESYPGRVAITATAHIERFPRRYRDCSVLADGEALYAGVRALRNSRVVAFAQSCDMPGRHAGVASDDLLTLFNEGEFDLCVVKADGARGRVIKAPAEHEPPVSPHSHLVVGVVSARAIGMPLTENLAHRPERVAAVSGAQLGEPLTPLHIARLISSDQGLLKNTGTIPFVPLINMVDDAEREQLAREAALQALKMTTRFDRVVLASMKRDEPLVAVVRR